jgi:hypothetical protein
MLVSSCSDPRSAATSEHNAAEADADGAAALEEGLPADAGLPDALPPEPHAAASSTRPERRMPRQECRVSVTLLILCERASGRPASPHTRRVKLPLLPGVTRQRGSCPRTARATVIFRCGPAGGGPCLTRAASRRMRPATRNPAVTSKLRSIVSAAGRGSLTWWPPRMSRNLEVPAAGSMSRTAHRGPAGPPPGARRPRPGQPAPR